MLYYYNPNNRYITGLDPTYFYDRNRELWKLYERITSGDEEDAAPLIRERFGAEYVFTENQSSDFLDNAMRSGKFEMAYSDAKAAVLRLRSAEEIKKMEEEQKKTDDADTSDDSADDMTGE